MWGMYDRGIVPNATRSGNNVQFRTDGQWIEVVSLAAQSLRIALPCDWPEQAKIGCVIFSQRPLTVQNELSPACVESGFHCKYRDIGFAKHRFIGSVS